RRCARAYRRRQLRSLRIVRPRNRRGAPHRDAILEALPRLPAGPEARSRIAAPARRRAQHLSQNRLNRRRRRKPLSSEPAPQFFASFTHEIDGALCTPPLEHTILVSVISAI